MLTVKGIDSLCVLHKEYVGCGLCAYNQLLNYIQQRPDNYDAQNSAFSVQISGQVYISSQICVVWVTVFIFQASYGSGRRAWPISRHKCGAPIAGGQKFSLNRTYNSPCPC